ncbi:hypothetical protein A1O7_02157 [Cladophialophora yegresii CBS 114405]|uniref:BTB domain-containing protein n=1 Tax=Cladophialophora yegresii CBS 114405 TaxID=1182544 RepID=W9W188_9EURO|nr:uncharacterized protein A1O7_02157 [Cladophialophora yegresii CBS 114405]EXJ61728.1 hypothetical protein A1O7_02157 [Cladophialophora yegresii CBS 114405]
MASEIKPLSYLTLLKSGQYSDFVIECQGVEFKVHRAIVCPQSTMLERAANGDFREAKEGRIKMTEDDPRILSRVLVFLYTNDYETSSIPKFLQTRIASAERHMADTEPDYGCPGMEELMVHLLVFKSADMLGIEPLKRLASSRFLRGASSRCLDPNFAKPLNLVYEWTREGDEFLRWPVTDICLEKYRDLPSCPATMHVLQMHDPVTWRVITDTELHDRLQEEYQAEILEGLQELQVLLEPYGNDGGQGS